MFTVFIFLFSCLILVRTNKSASILCGVFVRVYLCGGVFATCYIVELCLQSVSQVKETADCQMRYGGLA